MLVNSILYYRATVLLDYATFWVDINSTPVRVTSSNDRPSGQSDFGRADIVTYLLFITSNNIEA